MKNIFGFSGFFEFFFVFFWGDFFRIFFIFVDF